MMNELICQSCGMNMKSSQDFGTNADGTATEEYLQLLRDKPQESGIETITQDYIFVKADRQYFKILFSDILFIEGLKDYVIIQTPLAPCPKIWLNHKPLIINFVKSCNIEDQRAESHHKYYDESHSGAASSGYVYAY